MPTIQTPLSEQIRIVLAGLRNSGKSSLLNHLFGKEVAIVSETPGTTADPVTRSMELLPLGAVAFTDTAGLDDEGILGNERIKKSLERLGTADLVLFVTRIDLSPTEDEIGLISEIGKEKPFVIVGTFGDRKISKEKMEWIKKYPYAVIDNINKKGGDELKKIIVTQANKIDFEISPLDGLVRENELVLLVTPIDLAAPKGRLILPQVETIRDLLDKDCAALIVKERELKYFYDALKIKPKIVITDSQAFSKVSADIPEDQLLTSFSIIFARKKGILLYLPKELKI